MHCITRPPLREKSNDIATESPFRVFASHQLNIPGYVSGTSKQIATSGSLQPNSSTLRCSPTVTDGTKRPSKDSCSELVLSSVLAGEKEAVQSSNTLAVAGTRHDNASKLSRNHRQSLSPPSSRCRHDLDASSLRHWADDHVDTLDGDDSSMRMPTPTPPIACTLVAFEPGALGLELEAVVDSRGRRLGCRVFRISRDGQAARHGSVHPGDALVVLDGVDVLSEPFDSITQALLERQDQHRLIGFMGAAAAVVSSRAADATEKFRPTARRHTRSLGIHESTFRAPRDDLDSARNQCRDPSPADRESPQREPRGEGHKRGRVGVGAAATRPDAELEDAVNATGGKRGEGGGRRARDSTDISRKEDAASPKASLSPSSLGSKCMDPTNFKELVGEPTDPGRSLVNRGGRADVDDLHGGRPGREQWVSLSVSHLHGNEQEDGTLDGALCQDAEALQSSLESSMEKTALTAERAWLLEELQRAREVTLDREGALAGQKVQNDVLKMEMKALEAELRRARQELGASEASRRELSEATKRDLARRDRDASDRSSQLRRERAARERDAEEATAAAARAADKAAKRAATAGQAMTAEVKRRADAAEARAAEEAEKRTASEAAAQEAAALAEAALRKERERREIEVRGRDKEITSLTSRVQAAEARCKRISEEKDTQMRELEEAAVRSLELAERRKSDSEDRAAALSVKLKEKEANIRQACRARMKELGERQGEELRKLKEALESSQAALAKSKVHGQAQNARLSSQIDEKGYKLSLALSQLRGAEQRARMLETGARAARQRAEASARKEEELSKRLAVLETERACQDVTLTTLRTQLEELRRGVAAGEAAIRENARIRAVLEDALGSSRDRRRLPHAHSENVGPRVCAEGEKEEDGVDDVEEQEQWSSGELADALRRRLGCVEDEVDNLREALTTARAEKETSRQRDEDVAELRSILLQKKRVSAELTKGTETARARAERAERGIERMRAEVVSSRDQLERTQRLLEEERARAEVELLPRLEELERSLADKRIEAEACGARAKTAEELAAAARDRQLPLQDALSSVEAERADVLNRLSRKDGELVAVQSQLENTAAELKVVKAALLQGSDQQLLRQREACMLLAVALHRRRARSAGAAIALSRWQRFTRKVITLVGAPEVNGQVAAMTSPRSVIDAPGLPTAGIEILNETRLTRSELSHGDSSLRIYGARTLLGVLREWANRQSWRAFRRLQFSRGSCLLRSDGCPVPNHLDDGDSRTWLPSRQAWDHPLPSAGDRDQAPADRHEYHALTSSSSNPRDTEAFTLRDRERSRRRAERSTRHSPPPPPRSLASAFIRSHVIESSALGLSNASDASLVSVASSEPRYQCLRDGSSSSDVGNSSRALDGESFLDISDTHGWANENRVLTDPSAAMESGNFALPPCGGVPDTGPRGDVDGDASWWAVSDESST